jgi:thioredoxin-like negative regulator of GroEL
MPGLISTMAERAGDMRRALVCGSVVLIVGLFLGWTRLGGAQSRQRGPQAVRGLQTTAAPTAPAERRTALVIGNAAYTTAPLRNPVHDAQAIAATLTQVGFQVTTLENATRETMLTAIADLGTQRAPGGVGLFFYAGHGLQIKGENYLVPVDAPFDAATLEDHMVPVQRVIERMEDAKNGVNILILDACRTNPFVARTRGGQQGLAPLEAPLGTIVAFAASRNETASDGEGPNGLYTTYLLQHLRTPGLPVEQLFKQVRNGVSDATGGQQVPEEWTKLRGEFFFVPAGRPAPPPATVDTSVPPPRPPAGPALSTLGPAPSPPPGPASSLPALRAAPTVVQVFNPGWPPCQQLKRTVEALRPAFQDRISFRLADLSTYEGQAFARQYQVGETTLVVLDATGRPLDVRHGVPTEAELRQYLDRVAGQTPGSSLATSGLPATGQALTVVQVFNPGWPPCQQLKRTVEALRPVFQDRIVFRLADLSTYDGQAFARQYQVGETTLVVLDATGQPLDVRYGVATEAELRQYLDRVVHSHPAFTRGRGR